jgi:hypothetical protein
MEHEAQPDECDQRERVEEKMRHHGKPPSYQGGNEGIVPGLQVVGISRSLEGHDSWHRRVYGGLKHRSTQADVG